MNQQHGCAPIALANLRAPRRDVSPPVAATSPDAGGGKVLCASVRRRSFSPVFALLVAALCSSMPSTARAFLTVTNAPGIEVIPAAEVLANHTQASLDGELLFQDPSGALIRLITSTGDPEISNPGDGNFHAADAAAVVAALESLPPSFVQPLAVSIFVLPYPRAGSLSSSATAHAVYISPGVYPLGDGETLRALVVHEIGHVIHQHFLAGDPSAWSTYLDVRSIGDTNTYYPTAPHAYRPAEIFAEDFRVLFGDGLASAPSIENPQLAEPGQVTGLYNWFVSLAANQIHTTSVADLATAGSLQVYPNPIRPGAVITVQSADSAGPLVADRDLTALMFDVSGRVVTEVSLSAQGDGRWMGSLPSVPAGTYWIRPAKSNPGFGGGRIHVIP